MITPGLDKLPKVTKVEGEDTIICDLFKPTKAIKAPNPAEMIRFKSFGKAAIIFLLIGVNEKEKKMMPVINKTIIASCHE